MTSRAALALALVLLVAPYGRAAPHAPAPSIDGMTTEARPTAPKPRPARKAATGQ